MTATTATATELGIRLSSDRFYAARAEGRYRVIDGDLIDARTDGDAPGSAYVATCASRAKAEAKAAALNEAAAAAEDALTAAVNRGDEAGADNARAELAELAELDDASPADARQARSAELAEAVAAGQVSFDDAAAELLGGAIVAAVSPAAAKGVTRTEDGAVILASGLVEGSPEANAAEAAESAAFDAAPAAKPVKPVEKLAAVVAAKKAATEDTRAYRIGKVLREFVLANGAPSELVVHITSRNVCYDGTATLRLTATWAEELSGFATALENAVMADTAAAGRAPAIMAARSAQKSLAKLF